jgi:hypothetical protein
VSPGGRISADFLPASLPGSGFGAAAPAGRITGARRWEPVPGNRMIEQIVEYLRERPEGVASSELAEKFLKFKNAGHAFALKAVQAILDKDKRVSADERGRWFCVRKPAGVSSEIFAQAPWVAVHVLTAGTQIYHVSLWSASLREEPKPLLNGWLADPSALPAIEREMLGGDGMADGTPFEPSRRDDILAETAAICRTARPFFVSGRQHSVLSLQISLTGETLTDDIVLAGNLFRAAGEAVPRPPGLASCCAELLGREPVLVDARRGGMLLAECLTELFGRLNAHGLETFEDLESAMAAEVAVFDFSEKKFDATTIASLPQMPGVYGFKDKNSAYLYVGKTTNLRRRIAGYFGETDESPAKLEKLRRDSVELMTSRCGSELESLIYEHRLIQKHKPVLNTQRAIEERKGSHTPLADCIVLLPHADEGMGLSVWCRASQKIALKPFAVDFSNTGSFPEELEAFFFSGPLSAAVTDFPEQEIATRWIRRHRESLLLVPVDRMTGGSEAYMAMKSYWSEMDG